MLSNLRFKKKDSDDSFGMLFLEKKKKSLLVHSQCMQIKLSGRFLIGVLIPF